MIFGAIGGTIMATAILISTFGCNNGLILSGARVYYAMAKDKLFFRKAGELNKNHVPALALITQAVWTSLLCLTGTYGQLLDYVIFAALIFYALTTIGLFILRSKRPDAERPYRAWGYPWTTALALVGSILFLVGAIAADMRNSIYALALLGVSYPLFRLMKSVNVVSGN